MCVKAYNNTANGTSQHETCTATFDQFVPPLDAFGHLNTLNASYWVSQDLPAPLSTSRGLGYEINEWAFAALGKYVQSVMNGCHPPEEGPDGHRHPDSMSGIWQASRGPEARLDNLSVSMTNLIRLSGDDYLLECAGILYGLTIST